ncbi:conserved hypothetical protein [Leishmania major strain Friedlin]|uniref:Uncharacterized protein n=1 Tax=Leishmania major TaxID=5664 RepID=Q4QHY5_LEIMA|nr:conserved hypothetical protein [Leishmania major strain Friedlin]CAG9569654.1 hypothetical_protein_-__conserved [Leishmania major strain Friedlin]CAJ02472.1 conserved hypothetical protein [Leishmania major strain Friedlin]|eukprot:XP_001681213.1 conserved hypothetical protein [Leishmania major strain Friedlin]
MAAGSGSDTVSSSSLDHSASAAAAALAGDSAHCASNASIAVFLFAKEKLLFRYPDTDPFVVDVAAQGSPATSSSSAATGGAAAATGGSAAAVAAAAAAAAAAADASSKKASGESNASSAPSAAHAAPSQWDRQRGRGPYAEQTKRGGGGGGGGNSNSGGTHVDPDDFSNTQTPTSSMNGGGGSRLKKSSHVHVTMAGDVKDGHQHHGAGGAQPPGGAAPDSSAPVSSSSGVAPQRGMRRPASSYSLVNDHVSSSGGSLGHGHCTVSAGGGGTAAAEGRRGLTARGQPGNSPGSMIQVQHTSTGSMRRQLSGAAVAAASSISGSSNTRKSTNVSAGAAAGGGGGPASGGGRNGAPQQPQQQTATTGAATCVGIAPNVLMHLLRGALCGTTTINMVNCTFLVFPLFIGSAAPNTVSGRDGTAGSSSGSFGHLDRLRLPHRSGTALLVVAMKEPDTDTGAIANFTQCFVNILCREEYRCQYVSTELERMEMLTNHWEVGGAAALASAAAAAAEKRCPPGEAAHHEPLMAGGAGEPSGAGGSAISTSASVSPARDRHHRAASPMGGGADMNTASSGNYDYLFSASRPALRHKLVPAVASGTESEKTALTSRGDRGAASGARTSLHPAYNQQHHLHRSRESSPSAASQGSMAEPLLEWADPDDDADGDAGAYREDVRDADHAFSCTASPSAGKGGEHSGSRRDCLSPAATASSALTTSPSARSLYQQLAVHVRLAYEVLRVARCIDVWNRTMRGGCSAGNGAGGGALEGGLWGRRTSCMTGCGRGAAGALREPRRRPSIAAGCAHQQQQITFASAGTAFDTLPEALLINHMLLLPMSHLTGAERQEETASLRSASSRIHPCSVLTVEADQFTEQLQHRYLDMMGRRYAKLIPLSTVYALLQALPSPRRAGSFYRSLELAFLEAVQRRHARAAAAAAANNTSITSVSGGLDLGVTATSVSQADLLGIRDTIDEDPNALHTSAAAAATATTAAGIDFLAMEIIDFLRVNGAISVASEMHVCFTHGEVTPVAFLDAAVARRRRHRLKAEQRKVKAAAAAVAALKESEDGDAGKHRKCRDHRRYTTRDAEMDAKAGINGEADSAVATTGLRTSMKAMGDSASASKNWMSSHTTVMGSATAGATPEATADPLDAVLDMETVPAALVLYMLECVVDTQQHRHQPHQQEQYHSLAVISGSDQRGETATPMTSMAGLPKTPSTGNTATVGSVSGRTPRCWSAGTISAGKHSSQVGYRANEHDTSLRPPHGRSGTLAAAGASTSLTQGWQGSPHLSAGAVGTTSSPSLHFATHTAATSTLPPAAIATAPQSALSLAAPGPLSVYCAWGSACPLCELLMVHPQCWTTRSHRDYTLGFYTINAARPRYYNSGPAIQLTFPSLDESVCTCARHARLLRDNADFTALMQNSYTGDGSGSSLLHSMQPWFMRPHMFLTPVTAAYGVSPYEVFERMSYHCNRLSSGSGHSQRLPHHHPSHSPMSGESAATAAPLIGVNSTSSLIDPDPRDLLLISRAQAHPHETSVVTACRDAAVGSAKEQGHTLLQCADIPEAAVEYLRRSAEVIKQRLDYARRQQSLLERYEQAWEQQSTAPARTASVASTATPAAAPDANPAAQPARSAAVAVAKPASSLAIQVSQGQTVQGAASFSSHADAARGDGSSPSFSSIPVSATVAPLGRSANPQPRSLRYGRRQLPLHTASRPLANQALLFDSTTPAEMDSATDALAPQRQQEQQRNYTSSTHIDPHTQSITSASAATPLTGVGGLLGTERSLPVEVLLQYVLHHVIALSWGTRGLEVDTLVRLLERNLRRLPPLLANLPYIMQLRSAGYTSALAAAASASRTTATSAAGEATAVVSSVFTTVHTRLAAPSLPSSVPVHDAAAQGSFQGTSPDRSVTSPYSGMSHAATSAPITEAEVQLLQAYEVLDQLSLMKLLSAYATWPVRTVPTRLLLHTVVNEFSDVLYVDSSERNGDAEH